MTIKVLFKKAGKLGLYKSFIGKGSIAGTLNWVISWAERQDIMTQVGCKDMFLSSIFHYFEKELAFSDIVKRDKIQLYAGDLANRTQWNPNLVGLVLHRGDKHSICHDITLPYPLPDNCVYSYQSEDVFEHIEFGKMHSVLEEIYRILKPGGLLRISVPDYKHGALIERSVLEDGKIVFDPMGGGTYESGYVCGGGHVWFPTYEKVKALLEESSFTQYDFLHYYDENGTLIIKEIDYSKGYIERTPEHLGDGSVVSIVVDE